MKKLSTVSIAILAILLLLALAVGCQPQTTPGPPIPGPTPPAPPPGVTYILSVTANPGGGGSISLSPAGGTYDAGSEVTLTAIPAQGYVFDRWSLDATGTSSSVTLTMDSSKRVTAHFTARYTLTTQVSPIGSGTVAPASGTYDGGTKVTLTATPAQGYVFEGWEGDDIISTSSSLTLTMDSSKEVIAYFKVEVEEGILYADYFDDNRYHWPIQTSPLMDETYIEDGAYHIVLHVAEGHSVLSHIITYPPGTPDSPDFGVEVEVTAVQAEDKWLRGLAFLCDRATDVRYLFVISGDGYYLLRREDAGEETNIIPGTESRHIRKGNASNTLRVICRNSVIELYVNGHLLKKVNVVFPPDIGDNGFGLVVAGDEGTHIAFDNLKMWVVTP